MINMRSAFEALPRHRLEAVTKGFSKAIENVKRLICEQSGKLTISGCRNYVDDNGKWVIESCHYDESDNLIRMDEHLDDDSYTEIFRHEMGHFIDDKIGASLYTDELEQAIEADYYWYNLNTKNGRANLQKMLGNMQSSSAYYCHYYSDILSGIFRNSDVVRNAWEDNGDAYWGHKSEYWNETEGPNNAVRREIFADLFAIYAENNQETVLFVERAFPNTTARFKMIIGGVEE